MADKRARFYPTRMGGSVAVSPRAKNSKTQINEREIKTSPRAQRLRSERGRRRKGISRKAA